MKLADCNFRRVERDRFGRWLLTFERDGLSRYRPIVDLGGEVVRSRQPIGSEVIECAGRIVGRKLTLGEEESILALPALS